MKFPYTAWVLMPSFKPVETVFVDEYRSFGDVWLVSKSGKFHHPIKVHSCRELAIAAGFEALREQQVALDKKQANINKRRAALEKAQK